MSQSTFGVLRSLSGEDNLVITNPATLHRALFFGIEASEEVHGMDDEELKAEGIKPWMITGFVSARNPYRRQKIAYTPQDPLPGMDFETREEAVQALMRFRAAIEAGFATNCKALREQELLHIGMDLKYPLSWFSDTDSPKADLPAMWEVYGNDFPEIAALVNA